MVHLNEKDSNSCPEKLKNYQNLKTKALIYGFFDFLSIKTGDIFYKMGRFEKKTTHFEKSGSRKKTIFKTLFCFFAGLSL